MRQNAGIALADPENADGHGELELANVLGRGQSNADGEAWAASPSAYLLRIRRNQGTGFPIQIQLGLLTIVKVDLQVGDHAIRMRLLLALFIAAFIPATLNAQTGCPANITAIPFHNVNRHEMIVEVSINHSGPYDFLFDTGTQVTVVDQSLAAELHLAPKGKAAVAGISLQGRAAFAQLDDVELGDHAATNQGVLIYDMKQVQSAGYAIRGLLGADFLSRFDVLINHALKVVCVDDTGAMLQGVNGEHMAGVAPASSTAKSRRAGVPNRLNAANYAGAD